MRTRTKTGRLQVLLCAVLLLTCVLPVAAVLMAESHAEFEQALTCLLATEILGPALILGLTVLVYFDRKADSASG